MSGGEGEGKLPSVDHGRRTDEGHDKNRRQPQKKEGKKEDDLNKKQIRRPQK
jgi:hypothetical protein